MGGLDDRERTLCEAIAKREALMRRELAEHVAIPTGRGFAAGLEQYRAILIERLTKLGAKVELVNGDPRPGWLEFSGESREAASGNPAPVVLAARAGGGPRVLIAGHLDTVHDPHGSFRELTIDADGSTARGPGVVDMKGGVLIALHALEALEAADIDLNWTVLLNCDEETGSFQSMRALREAAARHDVGICVEPALPGGALAASRMGSGQFMVEVFGASAHVGREFTKGVSAVYTLAEVITALARMARPDEGMIVNVGPLRGAPGGVTNVVPDYAACWGNVRYRDPDAGERLALAIDALATDGEALPRVIVNRTWNRPAKPATDQVMALAHAVRSIARDLGQPAPELASTGGVCDGNILQDAGLPTLDTLGVRGGNLHRPDEFIELPSIIERCQLLAVFLARLAGGRVAIDQKAVDKAEVG